MVKLNLCIAKELLLILLICNKNENKSHFFLFLPVSSYLCKWIRQEPLPDILVKTKH